MKQENRTILHQNLPLKVPYLLQIFPCYACNFRCQYCLHALPASDHGFISGQKFMDMDVFRRVVDDLADKGQRVKMLRFAGIGEPLLHPQIAEMVSYAVRRDVAGQVDIVTNASLLTPELSDRLLAAGLSTLRVSIEGLSTEEYERNACVRVDFTKLVNNIRYYFERCGSSKVYVKIIDYMLKGDPERERRFYDLFRPISHTTAIEHLTPTVENIDYQSFSGDVNFSQTQDGECVHPIQICPQAFYMLQCNPDGSFVPCCSTQYPIVVQRKERTIQGVWNGQELTSFRCGLLKGTKAEACKRCTLYQYGAYPEDILDGHEDELLARYNSIC